jgi:hypothetical protein
MAYEKLAYSSLVFILTPSTRKKIKGFYLSKSSQDIKLEKESTSTADLVFTYCLSAKEEYGFSLRQSYEERLSKDSEIPFLILFFFLQVT